MAATCDNCGASTTADYCAECSQPVAGIDMPATDFARELASEVLALDGRAHLTLGPLFRRPGAVARAYVAGQRARFVPPIRLYLFSSFAMFLMLSFGTGVRMNNVTVNGEPLDLDSIVAEGRSANDGRVPPPTVVTADGDTILGAADGVTIPEAGVSLDDPSASAFGVRLQERLVSGFERMATDMESFSQTFMNRLAQAMFVLLPAFALILKLAYRKRLYVHHVVFSIYLHCFVFLLVAVVAIPNSLGLTWLSAWTDAALLVIPVHLLFAMKRFYGQSWVRTAVKWGFVSMVYGLVGGATLIGLLVFGVLTL